MLRNTDIVHAMNRFTVHLPLKDHVLIRTFMAVHILYLKK